MAAANAGGGTRRKPAKRGRPQVHDESWSKVSVVLMDRQIAHLDRLVDDIRAATGTTMTRASLIRAFVDGVVGSGIDVTNIHSESELRRRVTSRNRSSVKR